MNKIIYNVSGMGCGACVERVKNALAKHAEAVHVTLEPPQATLNNPQAEIDVLNQALAKVGEYELKPV